ncbi:hypothetical protein ACZ90_31695 [Streptomyces albus subsp. albus]|nr:hypothetical protein ACZ90_31695 [Streptomyces albus subsp. albus]
MSFDKRRDEGGKDGSGDDGYAIQIAQVKGLITPLEESVAAAKAIAKDHEALTAQLTHCGSPLVSKAGEEFISAWSYGMSRLGSHADTVVERLYSAVAAYVLADLLQVKNFWPSDANIAKLPAGPSQQWVAEHIGVPEMDPRPGKTGIQKLIDKHYDFEDES